MRLTQSRDHVRIVTGIENSLDDGVEAVIQGVAGYCVDEPDVRTAGRVALAEHGAPQVVLADYGDAASVTVPDSGGHGGLARG